MNRSKQVRLIHWLALVTGVMALSACVPETVRRPTLNEARLGKGQLETDRSLRPGEIRGEILEIDPNRQEVRVRTESGRQETLPYDLVRTKVIYHGREYTADNLEAGDVIIFESRPGSSAYVDTIRIQEPVQARAGSGLARRSPLPEPRSQVLEGTVERVDHQLGVFEVRPRAGRTVTVSVPYNARAADVESFRRLRRGDHVRVEGEFVNPESFQLLAFLADSDRSQSRR